jgi:hypothetical protein
VCFLQAGVMRTSKRSSSNPSSSSAQWVATIQAAGGLVRTNIPMKNTILRIALTNKKQVLIPDVQKLINQLGNVNTDLFASRLLRPPSSVLLLPLRASGVGECWYAADGQRVVNVHTCTSTLWSVGASLLRLMCFVQAPPDPAVQLVSAGCDVCVMVCRWRIALRSCCRQHLC